MTPCRTVDPELFFDLDRADAAKRICGGCSVAAACLASALERDEPWGVWGGQSTEERQAMQMLAFLEPVACGPQHGDRSCYTAGCREPECTAANTAYIAAWRAKGPVTAPASVDIAQLALPIGADL